MTRNRLIQNADHLKQASPVIHWPLRRTGMRLLLPSVIGVLALIVFAPMSIAHFRLIEPASWLQESQLGDPQKMAPCGGTSADPGKPTGAVASAQGGERLHISLHETLFHPGFYRVALAVNSRDELPPDPDVKTEPSAQGPRSISAAIHFPRCRPSSPTACSPIRRNSTGISKPTLSSRTSTAPNVRFKLSSSWPLTV
jgi:hypothetical protein